MCEDILKAYDLIKEMFKLDDLPDISEDWCRVACVGGDKHGTDCAKELIDKMCDYLKPTPFTGYCDIIQALIPVSEQTCGDLNEIFSPTSIADCAKLARKKWFLTSTVGIMRCVACCSKWGGSGDACQSFCNAAGGRSVY